MSTWPEKAPANIRNACFGYIRDIQNSFLDDIIIPQEILHLCLKYSLKTDEFIDFEENMVLTGTNNDIVKMTSEDQIVNDVFGKIKTDNTSNMIYKWKIKILDISNVDAIHSMGIGICTEGCKFIDGWSFTNSDSIDG